MTVFIWLNSCVPGEGSGKLSMAVVDFLRGFLSALSVPDSWVSNFLVRKCAHFSEYALLGILASLAFDRHAELYRTGFFRIAVFLVFVPAVDEAIQLLVPGRSGLFMDILLDCCGGFTGACLCFAAARISAYNHAHLSNSSTPEK